MQSFFSTVKIVDFIGFEFPARSETGVSAERKQKISRKKTSHAFSGDFLAKISVNYRVFQRF